jgi:hypothetical protein
VLELWEERLYDVIEAIPGTIIDITGGSVLGEWQADRGKLLLRVDLTGLKAVYVMTHELCHMVMHPKGSLKRGEYGRYQAHPANEEGIVHLAADEVCRTHGVAGYGGAMKSCDYFLSWEDCTEDQKQAASSFSTTFDASSSLLLGSSGPMTFAGWLPSIWKDSGFVRADWHLGPDC